VSVFLLYFGWPSGAVYSNLLASVICVGLAWWRLRARSITHHAEQLAQEARHHRELLAAQASQHEELKRHVNAVVSAAAGAQAAGERMGMTPDAAKRHEARVRGERM
jgi:hypothetical protein